MMKKIQLLDCTLRDGAYIVNSEFGSHAMKGIIRKLQNANVDIIECGWLKNSPYKEGSTYYHVPNDLIPYLQEKKANTIYTVMIDWDRYDLNNLPDNDGRTIDAIRVVFPRDKFKEGISIGKVIKQKGYQVLFQAANTLSYSQEELSQLAEEINTAKPMALSVVDTFGAMYAEDMIRIVTALDKALDQDILIGFHSHNNQQLSFSLTMQFVEHLYQGNRQMIADASLCGMGRGAGNTTTELLANYLNRKYHCNYDMNAILDAIDMYMGYFSARYTWGYSTPYFIAGMYCTHVNNVAYLLENHRTSAMDMRNIIDSLPADARQKYDYDLLEHTYLEYQNKIVNDDQALEMLEKELSGKEVLLLSPGRSLILQENEIKKYIHEKEPIVIGVNAICQDYKCDYLFFSNKARYQYAQDIHETIFKGTKKIITSNIKTDAAGNELVINFNLLVKRGWEHFDNATITCLRLMNKLRVEKVCLAGFDGFVKEYEKNYSDISLPNLNPENRWEELNEEIQNMFDDFRATTKGSMEICFLTESRFV